MQHWKQITSAIILSYLASLGQPEEMLEPRAGKVLKTNKQEEGGEEEKLSLKEGLRLTWTAQITLGHLGEHTSSKPLPVALRGNSLRVSSSR